MEVEAMEAEAMEGEAMEGEAMEAETMEAEAMEAETMEAEAMEAEAMGVEAMEVDGSGTLGMGVFCEVIVKGQELADRKVETSTSVLLRIPERRNSVLPEADYIIEYSYSSRSISSRVISARRLDSGLFKTNVDDP